MRTFFPLGASLFTCRAVGKWRKCRSILGPDFENIRVVQQIGSKTKMWDVGCDRMDFAINSDLCLIRFDSKFSKWSLDQCLKTNFLLVPY